MSNDFNNRVHIACSSADAGLHVSVASGSPFHPNPYADLQIPEPLYETRIAKKDAPVSQTLPDDTVTTMRVTDYDPNQPLIDADRYSEEQRITNQLSLQADARLAAFMHNCRALREAHPDDINLMLQEFANNLIDLYFDGRLPLPTTLRHSTTMKLVLKAELVNLIASHGQGNRTK